MKLVTPMNRQRAYVVVKDGLYLSNYIKSDIREFDGHGKLTDVYTSLFTDSKNGAKVFKHKNKALEVKRLIDGDAIEEVYAEVDDDA